MACQLTIFVFPCSEADTAAVAPFVTSASSRLKLVLYGGCALSAAAYKRLTALGVPLSPQYGQTEVGGMAMIGRPGVYALMQPVPGVEVALVSDDGEAPTTEQAVGELELRRCLSATPGYLNVPPPETPRTVRHRTGDLFRRSEPASGGTWYEHVCRKDDLILHTTGEMTNPLPMEDALIGELRLHGAARAVVIGQNRPCPVLIIERADEAAVSNEGIDKALTTANANAPEYSRIRRRRIHVLPPGEVPLTTKGSVLRHQLEKHACAVMDMMDEELWSGARIVDVPEGQRPPEDIRDSLAMSSKPGSTNGAHDAAFGYVLAWAMYAVLLTHSSQANDPRHSYAPTLNLQCLEEVGDVSKRIQPVAMWGFIVLMGLNDGVGVGRPQPTEMLRKAALTLLMYVAAVLLTYQLGVLYRATTPCFGDVLEAMFFNRNPWINLNVRHRRVSLCRTVPVRKRKPVD